MGISYDRKICVFANISEFYNRVTKKVDKICKAV